GVAWRDVAAAWPAHEMVMLCAVIPRVVSGASGFLLGDLHYVPSSCATRQALWTLWLEWRDNGAYRQGAHSGHSNLAVVELQPLYPVLERLTAPLIGGDPAAAGFLLSNGVALGAYTPGHMRLDS